MKLETNFRTSSKLVGILLVLLLLVACDSGSEESGTRYDNPGTGPGTGPEIPSKPVANQQLRLQPANNCDELKNYITQSLIQQYASIPKNIHYFYCPAPVAAGGGSGADLLPPAPASPG